MSQAEGEDSVLVAGDPERQHMKLCEEKGGIPYHPNQIQFGVSTDTLTGVFMCGHCHHKELITSTVVISPMVEGIEIKIKLFVLFEKNAFHQF